MATTPGAAILQPKADPLFSGPSQPAAPVASALRVRVSAPADAAVGALMGLRIEVTNAGGATARDVVVSNTVPTALSFVGSQPQPEDSRAANLEWRLGDIPAGKTEVIDANLRIDRAGAIQQCATVTAADGVSATNCATTNVASPSLNLRVTAPKRAAVGDTVMFEITAENRGNLPATDLKVIARFDDGLVHVSDSQALEKEIDPLPPGKTTTIGISLEVTRTGTLCNEVELTGAGGLRETAQACIEGVDRPVEPSPVQPIPPRANPRQPDRGDEPPVTPTGRPSVAVRLKGPASAFVGGIADFFVDVYNNGATPLTDVNIAVGFDKALTPVKADGGYERDEAGNIVWKYPQILAGKAIRLRVQCRCDEQTARACGRATATCNERVTAENGTCLRLETPRTELSVKVTDLHDPIDVGKELFYEIQVTNLGPATDRQVVVSFTVPQGMTFIPLGSHGPDGFNKIAPIQPPVYRFMAVNELPANKTLTWVVHVQADKAGDVVFKARVDSQGSEQPIDAEQRTKILPR